MFIQRIFICFAIMILIPLILSHTLVEYTKSINDYDEEDFPLTFLSKYKSVVGYISLYDKMAPLNCFHWNSAGILGSPVVFNNLSKPLSFESLINNLKMNSQLNSLHFIMEETKLSRYLNIIADNTYSFSLTYMSLYKFTILQSFHRTSYLNELGIKIKNEKSYEEFIEHCGDSLITHYDRGLFLLYTIKLIFPNSFEKDYYTHKNSLNLNLLEIPFDNLLQKLRIFANLAGIQEIKIEIYSIEIGGTYSNEIIRKTMSSKNFLLSNCTSKYINNCLTYIPDLIEYFYNFTNVQIKEQKYSTFGTFYYNKLNENENNDLNSKIKNLISKINLIKFYYDYFLNMKDKFPLKIEEIEIFREDITKQRNYIFNNKKLLESCRKLKEYNICIEELFKNFDLEEFANKLNNFITSIQKESLFQINIKNKICLPKNMVWTHEGIIQVRTLKKQRYFYNNLGLTCTFKTKVNFVCFDDFVYLDFVYLDDELFGSPILICQNLQVGNKKYNYVDLIFLNNNNPFLNDLLSITK